MNRVEQLAEGVTLYLGDCREILPTLGKVDAFVSDVPYGIALDNHALSDEGTNCDRRTRRDVSIVGDHDLTIADHALNCQSCRSP